MNLFKTLGFRAGVVSAALLLIFIAIWYAATVSPAGPAVSTAGMTTEQIEYQKMMGKDPGASKGSGFPTPADRADLRAAAQRPVLRSRA